ncbi:MAG: HAMP domain-containing histidine kinase [Synergistaceae bacterium]|jgi:signal transduction histidine kinase|nr:HAMP domain-containing histidine kinase [Synergistaceae bacterium]
MSIKQRLFFSNILMLVIPVATSLAIFFAGLHFFATLAGLGDRQREGRFFMEAAEQADELMNGWERDGAGLAEMIEDARAFNGRYGESGPVLLIFRGGKLADGGRLPPPGDILSSALTRGGTSTLFGRTAARVRGIGEVQAVLYERLRMTEMSRSYRDVMFNGTVVSVVCAAVAVLLTNAFLTQFVFKKILRAMDTLTDGVRQIREGNLNFRIDYGESDEFSAVCGAFNDMAGHLMSVEEARRNDEQSRSELIAGISHDVRTPLTSIKAYIEGLEQGIAETPTARKRYIETIKNKTGDLERIIDTLFLFAKLDTGEFPYRIERVNLSGAVREIVDEVSEEYASSGLEISVTESQAPVFANIDALQMRNVLINIFENSLKYKDKARGCIQVSVSRADGEAIMVMSDDGPGVPEDAEGKLFGLFYRIDGSRSNPSRGSGLGLAIAERMVKHFGGSIEAKNIPDGGLSIIIRLPEAG